jgi:predicted permease
MFSNLYGRELEHAVDLRLIGFAVAVLLGMYALTVLFVLKIEKSQKTRGAMIQAIYRSNFVIMGIPVVQNVFGRGDLAVTAMMVTIIVPLYNVIAVLTLEVFRGSKPNVKDILKNLSKNPILIGAVSGVIAILTGLKLPLALETPINMLGEAASPLAILLLGASFNFDTVKGERRNLIICLCGRLIVFPAVGLIGGALMGFTGVKLLTLVAIFASPSAVTSFTMAQQMDSDYELAGNCVIFSSILSCFTMFLWIFALKSLGLI